MKRLQIRLMNLFGRVPGRIPGMWYTREEARLYVGPGWSKLVDIGFDRCLKNGWRIYQIKEKFGGLRFYSDGNMDDIEEMSTKTCEICGATGKIRAGGWLKTLCEFHAGERWRV